jgi:hypothetical protein
MDQLRNKLGQFVSKAKTAQMLHSQRFGKSADISEVQYKLGAFRAKIRGHHMMPVITAIKEDATKLAQRLAPHETGTLEESIYSTSSVQGLTSGFEILSDSPYATYQENSPPKDFGEFLDALALAGVDPSIAEDSGDLLEVGVRNIRYSHYHARFWEPRAFKFMSIAAFVGQKRLLAWMQQGSYLRSVTNV